MFLNECENEIKWNVLNSLNQNFLGMPDQCGFFATWNTICMLKNEKDSMGFKLWLPFSS
jgi:hypothetical protein